MQRDAVVGFGKRLVQQVVDDEVPDLAAGLAYRFLFAVFPFGLFLAALAAFVSRWIGIGDPTDEIIAALGDNLPPAVAGDIAPQLQAVLGETRPALLSIGALGALWAATGGVSSVIGAMNKAYDVDETRHVVARTALAIGLTIVASVGILVAFVTIVGGSILTEQVAERLGIGGAAWDAVALVRWPVVLALVALAVAALFRFGPNVAVPARWTLVGGAAFAVMWVVATAVLSFYVANFASYANTYGALGGLIALMLWFYVSSLLLLVAAEITSLLATHPALVEAPAEPAEAPADPAGLPSDPAGPPSDEVSPAPTATPVDGPRTAPPLPSPRRWLGTAAAVAILALGGLAGALAGLVIGRDEA